MSESKDTSLPTGSSAMDKIRHAFAIGDQYDEKLLDDEIAMLEAIAKTIKKRRLATIAIMFLHLHRPLNTIGASAVQMGQFLFESGPVTSFLRQFVGPAYSHEVLVRTMEKRCSIEKLIEMLEDFDDEPDQDGTTSRETGINENLNDQTDSSITRADKFGELIEPSDTPDKRAE